MNKKTVIWYSIVGAVLVLLVIAFAVKKRMYSKPTIGILQTASHPALDQACKGFIETLKIQLGDTVDVIVQNAQGSVAQAHTIAQTYHDDTAVIALYAIATLAAQVSAHNEKEKPIVIAAVTDPHALGIMAQGNVCGCTDMVDGKEQVALLRALVPAAQSVALLYNQGEINSQRGAQAIADELKQHGYAVYHITVVQESEIPMAIERACQIADAIMVPTDNTVASTITYITQKANEYGKPLIASFNDPVTHGALASAGVDYYQAGYKAANCLLAVLQDNKRPQEVGIHPGTTGRYRVNKKTLDQLQLTIPVALQEKTDLI